jgi:hypothetical protein
MKNEKSKLTKETAAQRGWKQIERDTIPKQVATDLLCTQERMTGPTRKQYLDARNLLFCSALIPKPREVKLTVRFMQAGINQLSKWIRRNDKKRRGIQRRYENAQRLPEETQLQQLLKNRTVAMLDLAAARLDQEIDLIQIEVDRRLAVCMLE